MYLQSAEEFMEMNDALDDLLQKEHNGNISSGPGQDLSHCAPSDKTTSPAHSKLPACEQFRTESAEGRKQVRAATKNGQDQAK